MILKDFERKWRLGRKKRGGGGGRVADGAFWGVDFGSEKHRFHIYIYIYIYVKTALFGIRKIEPDMRNVARTIGFRAFGIL